MISKRYINCAQYKSLVAELLSQKELPGEEISAIANHIDECKSCRDEMEKGEASIKSAFALFFCEEVAKYGSESLHIGSLESTSGEFIAGLKSKGFFERRTDNLDNVLIIKPDDKNCVEEKSTIFEFITKTVIRIYSVDLLPGFEHPGLLKQQPVYLSKESDFLDSKTIRLCDYFDTVLLAEKLPWVGEFLTIIKEKDYYYANIDYKSGQGYSGVLRLELLKKVSEEKCGIVFTPNNLADELDGNLPCCEWNTVELLLSIE